MSLVRENDDQRRQDVDDGIDQMGRQIRVVHAVIENGGKQSVHFIQRLRMKELTESRRKGYE